MDRPHEKVAKGPISHEEHRTRRIAAALEAVETREWLESLDYVLSRATKARAMRLLEALRGARAAVRPAAPVRRDHAVHQHDPADEQVPYPGDREIERRIKSLVRWNALAMVVRANRESDGIGGHISTYASSATLYEVAFNHFFRGKEPAREGDIDLLPGARVARHLRAAFLEGRSERRRNSGTSATNCGRAAASRRIRIPG